MLAATKFTPTTHTNRTILINSATAVKRGYYNKYALFLATNNYLVITYDYRGIGDSIEGSIHQESCNLQYWGKIDAASVIDYISSTLPGFRLFVVGHSFGGQLLGLTDNNTRISAVLTISAQSGYWRHWSGVNRWLLALLWFGLIPGTTKLFSYFPAKLLKIGENLPGKVALEWARWCRHPQYFVNEDGQPLKHHFESFHGNILSYVFSDDWMAPKTAVEALMKLFTKANVEIKYFYPKNIKVKSIGHFGFFREYCRPLWEESLQWINKQ